jgi:hypothetical protein
LNREQIYSALFDKVKTIPGFVTAGRKLKHYADLSASEQPAIFQAQTGEVVHKEVNKPYWFDFNVELYVYVNTSADPDEVPATQLNNLVDAIVDKLAPNWTGFQTLDGLVFNVVIDGTIETDKGVLGDQAYAIIPVKITAVNDK